MECATITTREGGNLYCVVFILCCCMKQLTKQFQVCELPTEFTSTQCREKERKRMEDMQAMPREVYRTYELEKIKT